MKTYEKYMQRCLQLASNGIGDTYPNPLVGSVIVYKNKIIGEGYHHKAGENHAEINAINSVKDKSLLKNSTLYVNLEPCSHFGKTPPCSKKIAELGIPRVIIGTIDTTDKVSGKGIKIMQDAGIEVITGVLQKEARELNKRFFTFHEQKRPYIILKWAQTTDGFIDKIREENAPIQPTWITEKVEKKIVHKWRAQEQAILVGTNTAKNDNPSLDTREWHGSNPVRIVIDNNLKLVKNSKLFNKRIKTLVFNTQTNNSDNSNLVYIKYSSKNEFFEQLFSYLYHLNIQSLIIEGGQKTLNSFIDANLWDEARIFVAKKFFGNGIKSPNLFNSIYIDKKSLLKSDLFLFKNTNSKI